MDDEIVAMEIDLQSKQEEKRTLKFTVNEKQQKIYFTHLPDKVKFIVSFLFIFLSFILKLFIIMSLIPIYLLNFYIKKQTSFLYNIEGFYEWKR